MQRDGVFSGFYVLFVFYLDPLIVFTYFRTLIMPICWLVNRKRCALKALFAQHVCRMVMFLVYCIILLLELLMNELSWGVRVEWVRDSIEHAISLKRKQTPQVLVSRTQWCRAILLYKMLARWICNNSMGFLLDSSCQCKNTILSSAIWTDFIHKTAEGISRKAVAVTVNCTEVGYN